MDPLKSVGRGQPRYNVWSLGFAGQPNSWYIWRCDEGPSRAVLAKLLMTAAALMTHPKTIPAKLKRDAIVEAIFEMRFDTKTIPEVLFGRLADFAPWKGFSQQQLPAYQIPAPMRSVDPNLRYAPLFELRDQPDQRAVRIGAYVLSFHQKAPYTGWAAFKPELLQSIEVLFAKTEDLTIRRLGFRYLNALRTDAHAINAVSDLDLKVTVADEQLFGNLNLNFTTDLGDSAQCTLRIATVDFAQGALPPNTSIVVDVDVFTKDAFKTRKEAEVKDWLEFAHTHEKKQFFRLLTSSTIDQLKEK